MSTRSIALASGRQIGFREAGDGPILLQVHGLGTGHHNYDLLTPHLAERLHVIDIDLPGYGESDPLPDPPSIELFADIVAEFMATSGYGPIPVHGTSMGGCVAMSLASRFTDAISRLIVTCSCARGDRASGVMYDTWRTAARFGGEMALAELTCQQGFSRGFWDRPESKETRAAFVAAIETATAPVFLRDLPAVENVDLSANVPLIKTPTLLLGADEDHITPVMTAASGLGMEALARLIPNARLEVFPACGHFISIERPRETAERIVNFVRTGE